jgi:octaprenyl-diphosphate synthase
MRELEAHDVLGYSAEAYEKMIRAKTASLMSGACELGALRASRPVRDALKRYGMSLGMAFQITDDLLDYNGSQSVTGKPSGLDLREHKITLPLIAALPQMSRDERKLVEQLMADPTPPDSLIESVITLVEARGGLAAAHRRAQEFALQAEGELDAVQPGPARDALRDCLVYAIERRS